VNLLDVIIVVILLLAIGMGARRGLKSGLYLMITLLSTTLAVLLLTVPMERLILNIIKIGSEKYPDAPAVAVLILERRIGAAYVTALLPSLVALFLLAVFGFSIASIEKMRYKTKPNPMSRIFGGVLGLCAGILFTLLFAAQLLRLPWPLSNQMLRESLIVSTLNYIAQPALSGMVGGV